MKRRLFSIMAACFVFVFASAQVKIYVKNSGNDINDGSEGNPLKTIEKAVSKVKANEPTIIYLEENATFNFEGALVPSTLYAHVDFQNDKKVKLIGKNTTLLSYSKPGSEGGQGIRILRGGAGSDIEVKGVNFVNGRQTEYMLGGAIYFAGDKLTLDSCKFINNEAGSGGAAIGSRGKQVIVNNCYFEGNYVIGGGAIGAAIMHCGPGASETSEDNFLRVTNSTFYKNKMKEGNCRGVAIGVFDQSTSSSKNSTVGKMEVMNCTFFENEIAGDGYEGVIDLTNSDCSKVFLVNNTFYNKVGALRIPDFIPGEIRFINNVVYAGKTTLLSDGAENGRILYAYNNILIGGERGVNENTTEPSLNGEKEAYHNVVETTATYQLANLGLATTLSNEKGGYVPYLEITNGSSPLVNAGMDDSSLIFIDEENIIPETDIRGFGKKGTKDIGAYEYEAGNSITTESISVQKFYELDYATNGVAVKNLGDSELILKIVGIDGAQIYSATIKDELTINNNELQKGIVVFILSNGKNVKAEKVLFN